uniref:Uncharacterized protein n=1 Tax=Medicago truncatula TaxID=3880 RepID=I3SNL6_MEDTR|nr:unknown [Medicago truncatula]
MHVISQWYPQLCIQQLTLTHFGEASYPLTMKTSSQEPSIPSLSNLLLHIDISSSLSANNLCS